VHAIVVQHGGAITIGSAPSGGARFEVVLPEI
jgi:signal transduction histidine kinase